MSIALAAVSLYVGLAFRRDRIVDGKLIFTLATAIGFIGTLGALWGWLDLWIALFPAFLVGPLAGAIAHRLTRADVLTVTGYLGKSRPN